MATAEPANEIIPRLWLGNGKSSTDSAFIRKHGIQVVFNCTKNYPFSHEIPVQYRIPVDDNLQEDEIRNMELWSNEIAYRIAMEYYKGRTILVHCAAGMQRSAAAVALFLMAHQPCHVEEAIRFIKDRRPIAFHPRANFQRAMDTFDRRFHSELLPEIRRASQ